LQGRIQIDGERCKACMFCIELCPKKCIHLSEELNLKGYFMAVFDGDGPADGAEGSSNGTGACNGCGTCALMCPEVAIEVERL
jgi:2-oxoglutarate ferredoxin oxidoreductase subunit delta